MPYMEFAGVEYTEKSWDSSSAIEGGATDVCGIIIIAEKGPINEPILVHSIDQAMAVFGNYVDNAYGMYSIKGFFQNGGRSLWINRVAHYTDITDASTLLAEKATVSVNDKRTTGSESTLTFIDKYHGTLGNKHGVKIITTPSVSTLATTALIVGALKAPCKIVRTFNVGDFVRITDVVTPATTEVVKISSIDSSTMELNFETALKNAYTINAKVETEDFTVETYYKSTSGDILEKSFVGVNMNPTSEKYVCTVMSNSASGSLLFDVVDEFITVTNIYEKNPKETVGVVYMTGGNDGLTGFVDADIIGDSSTKTGLYAFDKLTSMIHLFCPESASKEVIQSGYDYCTAKRTAMFFASIPSGMNPDDSADFRDQSGFNTSFGVLYHNWGRVLDPIGIGESPKKLIPLTGHVLGAMAKKDRTDVDSYGSAPAGESMVLLGVDSLEFDVDRTNGGIMYGNKNRNINPIVKLSNNGGIAVWGSRTQSSEAKWRQIHARRVFIYAEISIVEGTRWCAFKNKNETLYNQLSRTVKKFLNTLKGLQGAVEAERFEFVTGATINDADDPYVISRIGLNIVGVGEFIYFEFGHKPDGVSLSEI